MNLLLFTPIILFSFASILVFAESIDDTDSLSDQDTEFIPYEYQSIDGFMEIIVRDSQGSLVAYLKTDDLELLDYEVAKNMVNDWPVKKIIRNGQEVEVHQNIFSRIIEDENPRNVSGDNIYSYISDTKVLLLSSHHNGFNVENGDEVTNIHTVFRPFT